MPHVPGKVSNERQAGKGDSDPERPATRTNFITVPWTSPMLRHLSLEAESKRILGFVRQ
jgi:hypothetical protein